ncbi:hypothetical protein CDIF29631_04021 (plasmid) [Clostridioides difficile]|uniref:hypothetical protein n=1 Tax=Clostridioides difficile TaxID=1496 RepID=UPI001026AB6D|nr:hypothetical protein [Clostridioides difficile]MCW0703660.1 hypothetical protein [Clostridioides difficile]MDC0804792.1 hypothetical protein [Clostridium paraputrificum]VFF10394.1 Uncharacterised protein [Clostridioides difficile]
MKFYCENCNEYFNLENLSIKYDYSLAEDIIICPTCKGDLIPIHRKTELSLGFNKDTNKLIYLEYDSSDYNLIRIIDADIEDIPKPIISYMKNLDKDKLVLNGITITKNGNREGKKHD